MDQIIMYGSTWCPDCRRSKNWFDEHRIKFTFVNIEEDPAAADKVVTINHGMRSVPTIVFPSGKILVEPSNQELETEIASLHE